MAPLIALDLPDVEVSFQFDLTFSELFGLVDFEVRGSDAPLQELKNELKSSVASELGKPLRPRDIKFVADLPKTRNAKIMRRIVRAAFLGEDLGDTSSIGNPEAIDAVRAVT